MQGVRALCDKYGILMIADEVMSGFGRTGRWFAIEHWGVVPDMITMAKGLTSAYVQLGAVGIRQTIADFFKTRRFPAASPTAATLWPVQQRSLRLRCTKRTASLRARRARVR